MRDWIVRSVVAATVSAVALGALAAPKPIPSTPNGWRWPLDLPVLLTSGFGEHRENHFHNGLDLATQQRTGAVLRAIGDGEITRVRASGIGYGRSLYLTLDRGGMAVFGHLAGYNPEIAAFVADAQDRAGKYEVDLTPPPGRFRVKAGDVLGATGESGAGPPHLHFEMRNTAGDVAMSPFRFGFRIKDSQPPDLTEITVTPASPEASVRGIFEPVRVPLTRAARGIFRGDTVSAWGPVVLSVRTLDPAEESKGPLPVASLSLRVDGVLVHESRLDSVAYAHQVAVDHAYDARRARQGDRRVRRLFSTAATASSGVDRHEGGVLTLDGAARTHDVEIIARDASDNVARATFVLLADEPPRVARATVAGAPVEHVRGKGRARKTVRSTPMVVEAADREGPVVRVLVRGAGGEEAVFRVGAAGRFEGEALGRPPYVVFAEDASGQRSSAAIASVSTPEGDLARRPLKIDGASAIEIAWIDAVGLMPVVTVKPPETVLSVSRADLVVLDAGGVDGRRAEPVPSRLETAARVACPLPSPAHGGRALLEIETVREERGRVVESIELPLHAVLEGEAQSIAVAPGGRLEIGANDLYDDLWLSSEVRPLTAKVPPGITPRSPLTMLEPREAVFRGMPELSLAPEGAGSLERVALYVERDNGTFGFVGNTRTASGIGGEIRRLGRYVLLDDPLAPTAQPKAPLEGKVVTSRRPWISASIADVGSGVTWSGLQLLVDGREVIAEWDPEAGELRGQPRWELAPGKHAARVIARDRVGNSRDVLWRFEVSGGRHQ